MTKEDLERDMLSTIDDMIDRYRMEEVLGMSREALRKRVRRGMICNNLAFVLADVASTFLLDCTSELARLGVVFGQKDKQNFNQMMSHLKAARKWAEKSALPMYGNAGSEDACADSDWWYSLIKLIDDRTGSDKRKTNILLEYLLNMPSEIGLFDIKYEDFRNFNYDR